MEKFRPTKKVPERVRGVDRFGLGEGAGFRGCRTPPLLGAP